MGKGALDYSDARALGTVGLQERDYELAGFEDADVVIAVGYDLVEHAPEHWNPRRDKTIVVIDAVPAEIDAYYTPAVELLGDVAHVLLRLAAACHDHRPQPREPQPRSRLREVVLGRLEAGREDDAFPVGPPRALWELRQALRASDMLVSDVGLHKLWIARMFGAHEPNTVLIANGLAGMGFALPGAIAAKLMHPERRVVAVCGDGGFLMNCQELETATRLGTAFVTVVWEDGAYGSIAWKQRARFDGEHFGTDFGNPDFVRLAESFGLPAWRAASAEDFGRRLRHALTLDVPSLIVLPIDYAVDIAISHELGEETVTRT
jgi:acetolactate synthase-1/2/3 large subunit